MKVDAAIGTQFSYLGREVQRWSGATLAPEDMPEQRFEDTAFAKRFSLDPNKNSDVIQRYFEFAAPKTGEYDRAANTVGWLVQRGKRGELADYMHGLNDDLRAYAFLLQGGDDEGKAAHNADEKRINPIVRSRAAIGAIAGLAKELVDNRQFNTEDEEPMSLSPAERRNALDLLQQLAAMERRNSLVMVGDAGYVGRPLLSLTDQMAALRAQSPAVADELARRYATAKVLPTDEVAKAWPQARSRLLAQGSEADLSDLAPDAKAADWEFGGDATTKRKMVRGTLTPTGESGAPEVRKPFQSRQTVPPVMKPNPFQPSP